MRQRWYNLLFAHWRMDPAALRGTIPSGLELDTFDGSAWLGVVPFGMSGICLRHTVPLPWISRFLELNVRTYVVAGGRPGVYFFSLDAANPLAVRVARTWFKLPYFDAAMGMREAPGGWIEYQSRRTHRGAPPASFRGRYRGVGEPRRSQPGSLAYFLTERYCLYTAARDGLYRGDIYHDPWALQAAEAEIQENTMVAAHGFTLPPEPPVLHFAPSIDTIEWALRKA